MLRLLTKLLIVYTFLPLVFLNCETGPPPNDFSPGLNFPENEDNAESALYEDVYDKFLNKDARNTLQAEEFVRALHEAVKSALVMLYERSEGKINHVGYDLSLNTIYKEDFGLEIDVVVVSFAKTKAKESSRTVKISNSISMTSADQYETVDLVNRADVKILWDDIVRTIGPVVRGTDSLDQKFGYYNAKPEKSSITFEASVNVEHSASTGGILIKFGTVGISPKGGQKKSSGNTITVKFSSIKITKKGNIIAPVNTKDPT